MEFYINALLWLVIGIALGFSIYVLFLQPAQQPVPPVPQNADFSNDTLPPILDYGVVNITMLDAPDCDICNAEGLMLEEAKTVLLKSEFLQLGRAVRLQAGSAEAQAIISKYNLTTLPAVVIEGDVGRDTEFVSAWTGSIGTLEGEGALVTRFDYPPYYDIGNKTVVGLARAIGIRASGCLECGDPGLFISSLQNQPISMAFTETTIFEENDTRAQELIAQYNLTRLPALFLSEDGASAYPVFEQIRPLGTVENGWFVLREVVPPYVDLADNRAVRGLVSVRYLVNSSCAECVNITSLSEYVSTMSGIVIVDEKQYEADSPEGLALIERYGITQIPSFIYSSDAKYYYKFEEAWTGQNSTVEDDGSFVFRAYGLLEGAGYQNVSG